MGLHTLAEGVETKEQYLFLKEIGCELVQGFYFAKPVPLEMMLQADAIKPELVSRNTEATVEMSYYDEIGSFDLDAIDVYKCNDSIMSAFKKPATLLFELNGTYVTPLRTNAAAASIPETMANVLGTFEINKPIEIGDELAQKLRTCAESGTWTTLEDMHLLEHDCIDHVHFLTRNEHTGADAFISVLVPR